MDISFLSKIGGAAGDGEEEVEAAEISSEPKKLGVVFSVFKDRDRMGAQDEASRFEKALVKAGFDIYLVSGRNSHDDLPQSTTSDHLFNFARKMEDLSFREKWKGLFIMLM